MTEMDILKSGLKTLVAGVIALVLLSLFSIVYGFSGIHVSNSSGATDYKWEPNQFKSTMSEGFAWIRLDENGFNNPENSFITPIDVLIMGSSHMEAANIPGDFNAANRLRRLLPDKTVYNIGTSGHTIYQCAKNIRAAVSEYSPNYVVVETDQVDLDDEKMLAVVKNELATIPSYDSGLLYCVQKYCPALKIIFKNLQDWKSANNRIMASPNTVASINQDVLSMFLKKMRSDCSDSKLIILYQPKTRVDNNGDLLDDSNGIEEFSSACVANDIIFVDMTTAFRNLYDEQRILAHGFINTAVGEGHLNKYGHQVIAEQIAKAIMEEGR